MVIGQGREYLPFCIQLQREADLAQITHAHGAQCVDLAVVEDRLKLIQVWLSMPRIASDPEMPAGGQVFE